MSTAPPHKTPIKLVHIISGLGQGGAETMLYKLVSALARQRFEQHVISLRDLGVVGPRIQALGIPVSPLNLRPGITDPRALFKLYRQLRRLAPDVVQTWMYHADLIGGLAARWARVPRVLWNIRQSNLDPHAIKPATQRVIRAATLLSRSVPEHILCCSERARDLHIALGYPADRLEVIPNGFDLQTFRPDPQARAALRAELGIADTAIVIGLVARFDPQKDHRGFLRAAALLAAQYPQCEFLLCGTEITWDNLTLANLIQAADLARRHHLLGPRHDMPTLYAALDIHVCASAYGEGFPNAVGEAMACGVPCVVTDVGDSALLVGETGRVVPPRDPAAMTAALSELVQWDPANRQSLGAAARQRIVEHYALEIIAARYARCYAKWVAR
jgi:glycosyltransferase involved in cell wall biosynthesis